MSGIARQTFGELLRRRIRDYEYTVEQAAELVGMTPGGMYRLIEGKMHALSDGMKYRICLAFDIAPWVLEEVAQRNIDKLRRRYPEGFSKERSINRDD